MTIQDAALPNNQEKWRVLLLLALAEMLAMAVWFSATAVIPILTEMWQLSESSLAWLTMSVQIGFVVGALGSAVLNLAGPLALSSLFPHFSPSGWF